MSMRPKPTQCCISHPKPHPFQLGSGKLSREAFRVLKEHGTERPFTSPLLQVEDRGTFSCAVHHILTKSPLTFPPISPAPLTAIFDFVTMALTFRRHAALLVAHADRRPSLFCGRAGLHCLMLNPNPKPQTLNPFAGVRVCTL